MEAKYLPIREGDFWGEEWEYGWFQSSFQLGEWAKGKRVVMDLDLGGGTGAWDARSGPYDSNGQQCKIRMEKVMENEAKRIPVKMKTWVLTEPGKLELQEVKVPEISDGQVLVEIERACICNGSDPGIYHGHEAYRIPLIFGHEASGIIVRKGKDVEQFQVGQRVCWWFEAGAFAEYQAVTVDNVAMFQVPEVLSLDECPVLELVLASCR